MDQVNRRSALTLGAAALAGLVAYPLSSRKASAEEEHRWKKIHHAFVALQEAKEEIESTHHDWGGKKRGAIDAIDHAMERLKELRDWHE